MYLREIDWRIGPLHDIIVGISAGLAAIGKRIDTEEGFDGLCAREYAEPLLGLGFVAAQTYAIGTVSDLISVSMSRGKPKKKIDKFKIDCYKCDTVVKEDVTRILLINASANYFKHHDEWGARWPTNYDTERLGKVGITEKTEFPCIDAVDLLCGTSWELNKLLQILEKWRAHLFNTLL